jgi:GNAT superfamily N-acetyltransferase
MNKIYALADSRLNAFRHLFADYYAELECDEEVDHLLDEYIIADYKEKLIYIDIIEVDGQAQGFIIYQVDRNDNEWNFKEGWGDIRELYVSPSLRGKGLGKSLVSFAEAKLADSKIHGTYALPSAEAVEFFEKCGYVQTEEYNEDLDCPVFVKNI